MALKGEYFGCAVERKLGWQGVVVTRGEQRESERGWGVGGEGWVWWVRVLGGEGLGEGGRFAAGEGKRDTKRFLCMVEPNYMCNM
jgi:hypothetical protein